MLLCVFVLTESNSDRAKVRVEPASVSDRRKSTFYRRSTASAAAGPGYASLSNDVSFQRDDPSNCDAFTFNFPVNDDTADMGTAGIAGETTVTDSGTGNGGGSAASGIETTVPSSNSVKSACSALHFSGCAGVTPFHFDFDCS